MIHFAALSADDGYPMDRTVRRYPFPLVDLAGRCVNRLAILQALQAQAVA
jgi:hypothetical protein